MLQTTEACNPRSSTMNSPLDTMGDLALELSDQKKGGRRVFVSRDFYATTPHQLSVFVDDRHLELVDDSDAKWWRVMDTSTGQAGLVPADIIEEDHERQARLNTLSNAKSSVDPKAIAKKKLNREKGGKISFAKSKPEEIPSVEYKIQDKKKTSTYIQYDPELEEKLRSILLTSLDSKHGKLVRVYSGMSLSLSAMNRQQQIYKTVRMEDEGTIGEMALLAGAKFVSSNRRESFALFLRHTDLFNTVRLDPKWKMWQVVELAKVLSYVQQDAASPDVPDSTRKHYKKLAKKYTAEMGVAGLKRRSEMDFATRFQFILERT